MTVWWDADLLRELEDGTSISKWNFTCRTTRRSSDSGNASNNGTKSNPCLIAECSATGGGSSLAEI